MNRKLGDWSEYCSRSYKEEGARDGQLNRNAQKRATVCHLPTFSLLRRQER
jgi:hypothetical protein